MAIEGQPRQICRDIELGRDGLWKEGGFRRYRPCVYLCLRELESHKDHADMDGSVAGRVQNLSQCV
jgi:hypothetical protein